jgi:hypothetical protein
MKYDDDVPLPDGKGVWRRSGPRQDGYSGRIGVLPKFVPKPPKITTVESLDEVEEFNEELRGLKKIAPRRKKKKGKQ